MDATGAVEWAWATGLFDGEGCISFKNKNCVSLCLKMTDLDLVERFQQVVGFGTVIKDAPKENRKQSWTCCIHDRYEVTRILHQMLPYLGIRRSEKARAALVRLTKNTLPRTAPCGTPSGYNRHLQVNEKACGPCRIAKVAYNKSRYNPEKSKEKYDPNRRKQYYEQSKLK